MFLACFVQSSVFTWHSCCSQSRPTYSVHDCYVMRQACLCICYVMENYHMACPVFIYFSSFQMCTSEVNKINGSCNICLLQFYFMFDMCTALPDHLMLVRSNTFVLDSIPRDIKTLIIQPASMDFVGAKFYCPYALADGSQHIRIREKTLDCSSRQQCYLHCLCTS